MKSTYYTVVNNFSMHPTQCVGNTFVVFGFKILKPSIEVFLTMNFKTLIDIRIFKIHRN